MTAFVPSDTACFASSPGRISLTLMGLLVDDAKMREVGNDIRGLDLSRRNGRLLVIGGKL